VRDEEARERAERRAARTVRDDERKAQELVQAKDAAAADLKRVRQDSRSTAEQKAAADAAYRQALAAVVAAETGAAPDWAPPAEPEPETTSEDEPETETTSEDEPETGAPEASA